MRFPRIAATLTAIGALVALSACDQQATQEDQMYENLAGYWVSPHEYGGPHEPFLDIKENGNWSGSDGCNRTFGGWKVTDEGTLEVEAGPSTLIGCDGVALPSFFLQGTAEVIHDELVLYDRDHVEQIRLQRK